MRSFILAAVLAIGLVMPASAARRGPDVAEINWFYYDECQNVFWWQTDTEINIWAFRLEHPAAGWAGEVLNAANYPSIHGMTYAIYGPMFADLAGDYMLRVYFDNGTSRMEDVAGRVCNFEVRK